MNLSMYNGGNCITVLVPILVEENSGRVRTINVRREKKKDLNGHNVEDCINWICSCNVERNGIGMCNLNFWLLQCL